MQLPQKTILVIEDDPDVRRVLASGLVAEGFTVTEAASREAAIKLLERCPVDLITLDIGLGSDDGLQLAREIRTTINVPILIITGRAEPIERVRGLEHGADDYVTKPFHIREVILRVRTLLGRYDDSRENQRAALDAYSFDHAILDLRRRVLRRLDGDVIELTETEIRLLELFLRHPSRVLSRDEINTFLRGRDWSPLDRTLDGHIARLRRKIEPLSDTPHLIKSVRGVGYVFCG
ncbi:response regulator transcription factor [Bradyrhizobium viridifuturi]|uniref:response regulator transcription factor n=1 Tax=Bradyrhizobium viridifuturi TaxID=1654716 RepID=UPI00067EA3E2|nr:response regulator transcription factor [Bradyrhizobium viridifuturi]